MTTIPEAEAKRLRERRAEAMQREGYLCSGCGARLVARSVVVRGFRGEIMAICSRRGLNHEGYDEPPRGEAPWWVQQRREAKERREQGA